jgi:hypothetical protein
MPNLQEMIDSYKKHENLKIAGAELGISFQTLYWHLKKAGVSVAGNKERYGSEKDRFGVFAEKIFAEIVPEADDLNGKKFQSKFDFQINGVRLEIKAAKRQSLGFGKGGDRWAFSIKRQISECDFYVLFAFSPDKELEKIFLVPHDVLCNTTTISVSVNGVSKWHSYEVTKESLREIILSIAEA